MHSEMEFNKYHPLDTVVSQETQILKHLQQKTRAWAQNNTHTSILVVQTCLFPVPNFQGILYCPQLLQKDRGLPALHVILRDSPKVLKDSSQVRTPCQRHGQ